MSMDENIEKMKRNLSPEQLDKATQIYNQILNAVEYHNKFKLMSNTELAEALMLDVWSELPMWSAFSELIQEVIERLQGNEKL
jgi:hypothetical protein